MNVARLIPPAVLALALSAPASSQGDPAVIARIIEEGMTNSHVWETLTYLSEEIGPRLTGSTNLARANAWTR
ncbi:MAG: peptidase M28, partial [Planctomycetota bacterium]